MDGYKFVGASTDDVETGSLQLTGDAVKNHVTKGTTFYTVDPKNSLTGTLEPGNVSNLILSVSSGRNITVQWTNPIEELLIVEYISDIKQVPILHQIQV